ncbi:ABC-2 type transport system ATP-binding protein [Natranaerovirga hydrolytica]|uniref:ABC-2 type transport system ATP-binding protein n=1 Tax=Natranaerovirga hydrolytica TaxID=680378 RepID=A0A4R1N1E1_9FIRM|nr:ABC transporter ATP-binding protein [Natranaerovirga hydrolytica]TCK98732.1 ABC-2 type transport system ATP-binding protein [Natranaerovirga hydrolytica]
MELVVEHITKKYKDIVAVNDVNLTLTPGVWGLLGANGSGKTTLMRIICGILTQTTGEIYLDGKQITALGEEYRNLIGYLPQNFGYYSEFRVEDYLEYIAALKGLPERKSKTKIQEVLYKTSLEDVRKKLIRKLSGGMKRRVGIAQALLNEPQIMVLDEPTAGLDPGERVHFRNVISELAQERIVLISTHIVSDVEHIAANNAIMKNGEIIAFGTTEKLVLSLQGKVWQSIIPAKEFSIFKNEQYVVNVRNKNDGQVLVRYISEYENKNNAVLQSPCLEDLYLWLFKNEHIVGEEC